MLYVYGQSGIAEHAESARKAKSRITRRIKMVYSTFIKVADTGWTSSVNLRKLLGSPITAVIVEVIGRVQPACLECHWLAARRLHCAEY